MSGTRRSDRREEVLARADALAPEFRARAAEGETNRTMPADLAAKVKGRLVPAVAARVSRGVGADPITIFEVIEKLSHADGSAGWTALIGCSPVFIAWLGPSVAAKLLDRNPDICTTGVFAPLGRAVPDGNGSFTVDGRWPCNSGCPHSEWFVAGVVVMDGDHPRVSRPGGRTGGSPGFRALTGRSSTTGPPPASRGPAAMMSLYMGSQCQRT